MQNIAKEKFQIIGIENDGVESASRPSIGYFQDAWRRFRKNKIATVALIVLAIIVFMVIFGPGISGYAFEQIDEGAINLAPCKEHWFGTDNFGRDLFSRILAGARISVGIPLLVVAISLCVGIPLGLLAGFYGGKVDSVIVGVTNCLLCFPWILTTLALATIMGGGADVVLIALGIGFAPELTRLVRSITLSIREREYVDAAVVAGEKKSSVLFRYILPNTIAPVVIQATLIMSKAVLEEAAISYLGYGVQPPHASWGLLLSDYSNYIWKHPLMCVIPGLAIMLLVLAINFFGDGLRDMLDPRYNGKVNKQ